MKTQFRTKYLMLAAISGAIIALDQLTKILIITKFSYGESKVIIPDFFNLTYVRNPGAAFGFLASSHPEFREAFFLIIPPICMIIILWILRTLSEKNKIEIAAYSLIFSGAIGNYIDRLRFRYVIDFLDFHYKDYYYYPAFNVADSCIVIGVAALIILSFIQKPGKKGAK